MKVLYILVSLLLLLFIVALGVYYGAHLLQGSDRMWCSGSGVKTYGCNTDFGMFATLGIAAIALIVGLIIRAMTNPKDDNFKIEKEKESDD